MLQLDKQKSSQLSGGTLGLKEEPLFLSLLPVRELEGSSERDFETAQGLLFLLLWTALRKHKCSQYPCSRAIPIDSYFTAPTHPSGPQVRLPAQPLWWPWFSEIWVERSETFGMITELCKEDLASCFTALFCMGFPNTLSEGLFWWDPLFLNWLLDVPFFFLLSFISESKVEREVMEGE